MFLYVKTWALNLMGKSTSKKLWHTSEITLPGRLRVTSGVIPHWHAWPFCLWAEHMLLKPEDPGQGDAENYCQVNLSASDLWGGLRGYGWTTNLSASCIPFPLGLSSFVCKTGKHSLYCNMKNMLGFGGGQQEPQEWKSPLVCIFSVVGLRVLP